MTKWEYAGLRNKLYELAGTIGTDSEAKQDDTNNAMHEVYGHLSNALDLFEEIGIQADWLDRDTLEMKGDVK